MILYLDFDGVLHDSEVYVVRREPVLRSKIPGAVLFQHTDRLIECLATRPDVRIILSTSWVPRLGFDRTVAFLPPDLRARVVGATFHRHANILKNDWFLLMRYVQIEAHARRHRLTDWLAIDDDDVGWPQEMRHHLVHCADPTLGISEPRCFAQLNTALASGGRHVQLELASCEHDWQPDGQTLTAVRWTCSKCLKSKWG